MSMQQIRNAGKEGWRDPFFPASIDLVAQEFTARSGIGMDAVLLERAARGVEGFVDMREGEVTSDGYRWFRTLYYQVSDGTVVVAIPMACDTFQQDGTRLDRSPAVYMKGAISPHGDATPIVDALAAAMHDANERLAHRPV